MTKLKRLALLYTITLIAFGCEEQLHYKHRFKHETTADIDKKAILELLNTQTKAWNNGNIETYMQTYWNSDSLMFVGKNGIKYGWQNTLSNYKKSYPDKASMGTLDFELEKVEVFNAQSAFVLGKWHLARSIGDVQGHFTLLIKKMYF